MRNKLTPKNNTDNNIVLKTNNKARDKNTKCLTKTNIVKTSKLDPDILEYDDKAIQIYETPTAQPIIKLRLNTLHNVKGSINRVIRGVANGTIPQERARTMGFLLQIALSAWRVESELVESKEIRKQLEAIKEAIHE